MVGARLSLPAAMKSSTNFLKGGYVFGLVSITCPGLSGVGIGRVLDVLSPGFRVIFLSPPTGVSHGMMKWDAKSCPSLIIPMVLVRSSVAGVTLRVSRDWVIKSWTCRVSLDNDCLPASAANLAFLLR